MELDRNVKSYSLAYLCCRRPGLSLGVACENGICVNVSAFYAGWREAI